MSGGFLPLRQRPNEAGRWLLPSLLAFVLALVLFSAAPAPALAQIVPGDGLLGRPSAESGSGQMLLEADQLVYDYDHDTVSAVGHVTIYYKGNALTADRVVYDRKSGRLKAVGLVRITEKDGNVITATDIDITDDFADGFVQSLRVDTIDRRHFAAESAERQGGERTIFNRGVYTACEPCRDQPSKPPKWQVRAARIVIDHKEHLITFTDASLEFFGLPVAWLPMFWTPDETVARKSGILIPRVGYSDTLGLRIAVPYYWAIAPNMDVTFTPHLLTNQGFLAEAEFRHRLSNGTYTVHAAGLNQRDGSAFRKNVGQENETGSYAQGDWRGALRTTGDFDINSRWSYGWDVTLSSDRTFTRNYGVLSNDAAFAVSQIYLNGLSDRNYFDARAYYFQVLTDRTTENVLYPENWRYDQDRQAVVHPVIDHSYVFADPVAGGQLSMRTNVTALSRGESDEIGVSGKYRGFAGTYGRASTEITWERGIEAPGGQIFTPFAYLRGDGFAFDVADASAYAAGLTTDNSALRGMAAAGLEWRWPWLIATPGAAHVVEPVVQLIARPSETNAGALPNEDAQSLVFDDTTLFARDKFSGYDRVEGGTRLNLGLRYTGIIGAGLTIDGLVGQSYHLSGDNPFAIDDFADTGAYSGLETDRSDFVTRLSVEGLSGHRITARGRFDEETLDIKRGELEAAGPVGPVTASASLVYLTDLQNETSTTPNAFVLRSAASTNFRENWRGFGSVVYDLTSGRPVRETAGIAYDDECLSVSLALTQTHDGYTDLVAERQVWLRLQMRTLGGVSLSGDWNPTGN